MAAKNASWFLKTILLTFLTHPNDHGWTNVRAMVKRSPKLKCHQKLYITKTEMSSKIKCHQYWNVTKNKMSPKQKCHQN